MFIYLGKSPAAQAGNGPIPGGWAGLGNTVTGVRRAEHRSGDSPDTAGLLARKPAQTTAHLTVHAWSSFPQPYQPRGEKGRRGVYLDSNRLEAFPHLVAGGSEVS